MPGGQDLTGAVADFTDLDGGASSSDFLATIDWGDGTTSDGTVTGDASSGFSVQGEHLYPDPTQTGSGAVDYQVNVTITDVGGGPDGGGGSASAQTLVTVAPNDQPVTPPDNSAPGMSLGNKFLTTGVDGVKTFAEGFGCASGVEDLIGLVECPYAGASAAETGAALADPPDSRYRHVFHATAPRVPALRRHCFRLSRARCATVYKAELAYRRASLAVMTLIEDVGVTANRFGGAARARSRRYEKLQRDAQHRYFAQLRTALRTERQAGRALGMLLQRFHLDQRLSSRQIARGRRRMLALSGLTAAELRRLRADGLPSTRAALRRILLRALRSEPPPADTTLSSVLGL